MTDAEKLLSRIKTVQQGEEIVKALEALSSSKKAVNYLSFDTLYVLDSFARGNAHLGLVSDFKRLLYKTPTVSLTLAYNPSREFLERVKKWFEQNLGQRILLDLKVQPKLIAGAQILCKEHFRDYTVRRKLEEKGVLQ